MAEKIESSQRPIHDKLSIDQSLLERAKPPFAYQRTREFLQAVISEGGTIIPKDLIDKPEGRIRAREQNLIGSFFSSEATLDDLRQIYRSDAGESLTRERIRQVIVRGMRRLWENSSDKLKQDFPWNSIPSNKQRSLKVTIRSSGARGDTNFKLMEDIRQGKDYSELRAAGWSAQEIIASRGSLKRWGFSGDLPYFELSGERRIRFIEKLEVAQTPQDLRALFD